MEEKINLFSLSAFYILKHLLCAGKDNQIISNVLLKCDRDGFVRCKPSKNGSLFLDQCPIQVDACWDFLVGTIWGTDRIPHLTIIFLETHLVLSPLLIGHPEWRTRKPSTSQLLTVFMPILNHKWSISILCHTSTSLPCHRCCYYTVRLYYKLASIFSSSTNHNVTSGMVLLTLTLSFRLALATSSLVRNFPLYINHLFNFTTQMLVALRASNIFVVF